MTTHWPYPDTLYYFSSYYTISHNHFLVLILPSPETIRYQIPALVQETIITVRIRLLQPTPRTQLRVLLQWQVSATVGVLSSLLRADDHVQVATGEPLLQVLVHLPQEIDCLLAGEGDPVATHHRLLLLVGHDLPVVPDALL